MKRILTLFVSFMLLVSCFSLTAFADSPKTLLFEVSVDGEDSITVNAGDRITVDFTVENITDNSGYSITNLQNYIEFDDDFFEFTEGDVELVTAYFSKLADNFTWGAKCVQLLASHLSGGQGKAYEDRQLVARVTFKVKDGLAQGTSGRLENKACEAADGIAGVTYATSSKGMTVYIGSAPAEKYTLTYKNGGTVVNTNSNAVLGSTVDIYSAPTMADKKFAGWKDAAGRLWQPGEDYTVSGDMTFTAVWLSKYTLTFNTNGGSAIAGKVAWEDETIDLSQFTPTRSGYTFAGWYEDAGLTTPISSMQLSDNKTIYAKWTENLSPVEQYTLTFNTNGGNAISSITADKNTVINLSGYTPTRSGYTFEGWYKESGLTNKVTSVTLTANMTVYAKWEKTGGSNPAPGGGVSVTKYTLSFETNGGTAISAVSKVRNTTVDLSKYITRRDGYSFDGWYTDKELTQKVTEVKMTKNIVLYAKWVEGDNGYVDDPNYKPDIMTDEHYAYIVGRNGGYVYPNANITRAEAATIFFRLLNEDVRNEAMTKQNVFSDVNEGDWFNTAISTLANLEILNGRTATTFAPNAPITRAELTTIVARLSEASYSGADLFTDISGHWARGYINTAASINWVNGNNGLFRPNDNMTRAEVMTLINRALNRLPETKDDLLGNMFTAPDNTDTTAWYYIAIQEATNSHAYEVKADGKHEKWISLTQSPDWTALEK